jgi:hypothetical protein
VSKNGLAPITALRYRCLFMANKNKRKFWASVKAFVLKSKTLLEFLALIGLLVYLWHVWVNWQTWFFGESLIKIPYNVAERGQLGDTYGPMSALFSGLAFLGVLYTVYLQISDNSRDSFETNFFRIMDIWRDYVKGVVLPDNITGKSLQSNAVIEHVYLMLWYNLQLDEAGEKVETLESFKHGYSCARNARPEIMDAYFRLLYHTFRFAAKSPVWDKESYTDIVRAALSPGELVLLAFNGLTDEYEGGKFKKYIIQFHLLKHLAGGFKKMLIEGKEYPAEAFND